MNGVRLKRLTDAGLLQHVSRGVYLVPGAGYPAHLEIKAAWLRLAPAKAAWQRDPADPDSGVVSHASACLLHDLGDIPAGDVEITVPRRRVSRDPEVRLRIGALKPADITLVDGLPVTTAERTIIDLLRARADAGHIGGVIAAAEHRDLITVDALADRVQRFAKAYGMTPTADGRALIDHLVAQAGSRLRADELTEAARAAYSHGATDAARILYLDTSLLRLLGDARQNSVLPPETLGALQSILPPADVAANLREQLASLNIEASTQIQEVAERMVAPITEVLRKNLSLLNFPPNLYSAEFINSLARANETAQQSVQAIRDLARFDATTQQSVQTVVRALNALDRSRPAPVLPPPMAEDGDARTTMEHPRRSRTAPCRTAGRQPVDPGPPETLPDKRRERN